MAIKITVWNEDSVQETNPEVLKVYKEGLLGAVADMFPGADFEKGKMELILPNSENQQDGFFICELIKK